MNILKTRLGKALDLTNSLAARLSSERLKNHNGSAPSNTIGAQFWCVVGARESYARAFEAGAWQGFACSLKDIGAMEAVQGALSTSKEAVLAAAGAAEQPWSDARQNILFDLLEHEAQHQGQLIRYFYANGIDFGPDFAKRYTLQAPKAKAGH